MALVTRLPYVVRVGLLAAIYFVAAKLSLLLAIPPGYATAVWPPSGIAVVATLLLGRGMLPGIWIGAALVNLTVASSLLAAVFIASGNTLEALVGAALIRRYLGIPFRFQRGEDVMRFAAFAALSAAIAATVALVPLAFNYPLSWPDIGWNWWTWWQGDAAGMIIVAPLILSWCVPSSTAWSPRKALEAVCFAFLLLIVARVVFGGGIAGSPPYATTFAILPFFIWAAFRFGQREVTTAIAAVCGIVVWYTLERHGPFATAPLNESLLLLLAFISTVVISGLVLSAVLGERARAIEELRRRHEEVEGLVHERTLELQETNVALELDVAARERSEKLLYESEHRFRSLTDLSADWYWEQDENLRFTFLSSTLYDRSAYTATSIVGKTRWEIPDTVPLSSAWAEHRAILAARQPFRDFEYRRVGQDEPVRFISVSGEPIFNDSGEFSGYRGIGRDITERKRAEERLAYLALFDTLTGLPNRHGLNDHLTRMLVEAQRTGGSIGCMIVKLDHFKDVNSIYGRRAGDQLLVEVAERLRRSTRDSDTVGRLGDDEFALVLSNLTRADDAGLIAQKVLDALAPRFDLGGLEIYISANIGIAIYPDYANDPEELLKKSEQAMHDAKEQGRNTFRFYLPRMNERTLKRLQLDASLRGALERKEFLLHYQPKVDLATGVISGLEALLRWQHPEWGLMAPAEFVPILEKTGLIAPVGEWVLRTVCEQIKVWQARRIMVRPVAVNLSAQQFRQADFDAQVRALITKSGVDCRLIELEITESMLMHDPAEAAAMLSRLKRIGVKLSLDDFGTGYSSLAYLKRFPLDALKIDRTFVRDVTVDSDDAAIAVAIINLAHNLKLKVVAEGVETEAQVNFLRSHGCDEMQGYYFARPMSVEDCTKALREDRCLHFPKPGIASPSTRRIFRPSPKHFDGPTTAGKEIELAAVELEWLRRCNAHTCAAPPAVIAALGRAGFATLDDVGRLKVTNTGRDYVRSCDSQIMKRRRNRNH